MTGCDIPEDGEQEAKKNRTSAFYEYAVGELQSAAENLTIDTEAALERIQLFCGSETLQEILEGIEADEDDESPEMRASMTRHAQEEVQKRRQTLLAARAIFSGKNAIGNVSLSALIDHLKQLDIPHQIKTEILDCCLQFFIQEKQAWMRNMRQKHGVEENETAVQSAMAMSQFMRQLHAQL